MTQNYPNVKFLGLDQFVKLWLAVQAAKTPPNLACSISSGNFEVAWPSNYTGLSVLQTQTNSLTGTWHTIPESAYTNAMTFPLDSADPAVFYRFAMPP